MAGASCVFLDRDGTITVERGYITAPANLELIPGSAEAIRMLNDSGIMAVVASNQSGVARALMSERDLAAISRHLEELLAEHGARLDGAYYCPHLEGGGVPEYARKCECRKPATGMLELAARDLGIDLPSSYVVGDQATDIELANRARIPGILVTTGKGPDQIDVAASRGNTIARTCRDLMEAVVWIIDQQAKGT